MARSFTISQEALEEVYTALKLMLLSHPEGCGATDVWREFFQNIRSRSCVDNAMNNLANLGHLKKNQGRGVRKLYVLTNKEFKIQTPQVALPKCDGHWRPRPSEKVTENPGSPDYWIDDLNKVISALCILQEAIPGLKIGLLDMTKNLERLSKVQDILGVTTKAASRNI